MTKKGVYFSFDAIIASVIFILTIISLLSYWYSVRETIIAEDFKLNEEAIRISNLIFTYSDSEFGFATSIQDDSLDLAKIQLYSSNELQVLKEHVATPYDFSITFDVYSVTSYMGSITYEPLSSVSMGVPPDANSTAISKVVRIAPLSDGRVSIASIYLYE